MGRLIRLHLLLALAAIILYCQHFEYPYRLVPMHMAASVALDLGLCLAILALGCLAGERRLLAARLGVTALTGLAMAAGAMAYTVVWLAASQWNDEPSLDLIQNNIPRIGDLLPAIGVPFSLFWFCLALALAGIFWAAWRMSARLGPWSASTLPASWRNSPLRRMATSLLCLAALADLGAAAYVALERAALDSSNPWRQEPWTALLYPRRQTLVAGHLPLRAREVAVRGARGATDVILIISDSLRADHMGVYGYPRPTTPFLNAWKAKGGLQQARYAVACGSSTIPGVVSTLSSRQLNGVADVGLTLPDALRARGYETNFILSGDHHWYGQRDLYAKSVDRLFDEGDFPAYHFGDDEFVLDKLWEILPEISDRRQFFYIHLMSSHELGRPQARFRRFRPARLPFWMRMGDELKYHDYWVNNYDNRVLQTDAVIQAVVGIFQAMESRGHKQLFIIMSDHGQSLGEHGRVGHGFNFYSENLRIPLLIHDDGDVNYRGLAFASQLDVAPTVMDRLGFPVPKAWQGRSLLKPPLSRSVISQVLDDKRSWMAVTGWKDGRLCRLLRKKSGRMPRGNEEFYDLDKDPEEKTNEAAGNDPRLAELRKQVRTVLDREGIPDKP